MPAQAVAAHSALRRTAKTAAVTAGPIAAAASVLEKIQLYVLARAPAHVDRGEGSSSCPLEHMSLCPP